MLTVGLLTCSDERAIHEIGTLAHETHERYRNGRPFNLTVNSRARMQLTSVDPIIVTREYGHIIRKGPHVIGSLALAGILRLEADGGDTVAPMLIAEVARSLFYGFPASVKVLNDLCDVLGRGTPFVPTT